MAIQTKFDGTELVRIIGRKHCPQILAEAEIALSAEEIHEQTSVPIASLYRRLDELRNAGFLTIEDHTPAGSTRKRSYRRSVNEIRITFDDERLTLDVTERRELPNKLDDLWGELSLG